MRLNRKKKFSHSMVTYDGVVRESIIEELSGRVYSAHLLSVSRYTEAEYLAGTAYQKHQNVRVTKDWNIYLIIISN